MHADLLARLLPPVAYQPAGHLAAELSAEGRALDAAQGSAGKVAWVFSPDDVFSTLPDWERVLALTPPASAGVQQRVQAIKAKLAEVGGLSIPYFTQLAAAMGYQIRIEEPQPFRVGINRAGEPLAHPDVIWTWRVIVTTRTTPAWRFRAGVSAAGEALQTYGDPILGSVFEDLKPAWTRVWIAYQEG